MRSTPLFPFTPLPPPPKKKNTQKKTKIKTKTKNNKKKLRKQNELTLCSQSWQIGVTETECIVWEPFFFERPWEKGEDEKQTPSQFEMSVMAWNTLNSCGLVLPSYLFFCVLKGISTKNSCQACNRSFNHNIRK